MGEKGKILGEVAYSKMNKGALSLVNQNARCRLLKVT